MLSEEKIIQIVKLIRTNPFLKKYEKITNKTPSINVRYNNEVEKLELQSICFSDYDELSVSKKCITLIEYGCNNNSKKNVLLEYDGWDALCDILGVGKTILKY